MRIDYFYLMRTIIAQENRCDTQDLGKFSDRQVRKLLKVALSNRVLFLLSKNIKQHGYLGISDRLCALIDRIVSEGERINQRYAVLLGKIKEEFMKNQITFLIVKTDRKIDYVLSDLDILVEDKKFNKAQELLAQMAMSKNISDKEERWQYTFDGKVKIDIHKTGTDWYSDSFVDARSIWNDTQQRQFLGDIYRFPSEQNEWIFNVLNIIYEKYSLTYLDLLYLQKAGNINHSEINKIAQKHYWDNGLRIFDKYLKNFERPVNSDPDNKKTKLPLMFSFVDFFRIFIARLFRFRKETRLSLYFFLYYFYCKLRYWLSGGYRISFVGKWFEF